MRTKILEVRDRMTYVAVLAVQIAPGSTIYARYYLRREGYRWDTTIPHLSVLLTRLSGGGKAECDPYAWADRTMKTAHSYIVEHFDLLQDGDVVDVEFLLGETTEPKKSERLTVAS